jgi:Ca2+-transporting ATPase
VIFVTAVSDYKQSLQFQHLNEEKQNIQVEVIRGGRRIQVSIFDIVVGDVVALKIGDQVRCSKQIWSSFTYVCVVCIPDIIMKQKPPFRFQLTVF